MPLSLLMLVRVKAKEERLLLNPMLKAIFQGEKVMKLRLSVPAAVLLSLSVSAVLAKDKPSEAFLKKAIEGNYAEVSMGDLAQRERSERRRQVVCENAFN